MLDFSETKNPKAIEELVCLKINRTEKYPMTMAQTEMLVRMLLAGSAFKLDKNIEIPFGIRTITSRIQTCPNISKEDIRLPLFLVYISQVPAIAVMYIWHLQYWGYKNHNDKVDLEVMCEEIFPFGFPSKESMMEIWDGQKVMTQEIIGSDNLVDYSTAGESILKY